MACMHLSNDTDLQLKLKRPLCSWSPILPGAIQPSPKKGQKKLWITLINSCFFRLGGVCLGLIWGSMVCGTSQPSQASSSTTCGKGRLIHLEECSRYLHSLAASVHYQGHLSKPLREDRASAVQFKGMRMPSSASTPRHHVVETSNDWISALHLQYPGNRSRKSIIALLFSILVQKTFC